MKYLGRLDLTLARAERGLLALTLFTLIGLSVTQILLRNLVGTSWFWIDPFNRLLVLWLALLGALVATRRGEHIAIDALRHYLGGALRLWSERLALAAAALVTAGMAWYSGLFVLDEYRYATPAFAGLPAWPFQLIMPLAFGLMALRFAIQLVAGLPGGKDE